MDSAIQQERHHRLQLAIPDQGIATHDGQMQGPNAVDQGQNSIDKLLTLAVGQAAQGCAAPQVRIVIGVASWALQRTLAGNLDRERGSLASKNLAPSANNF
jgi:hypothetical protein